MFTSHICVLTSSLMQTGGDIDIYIQAWVNAVQASIEIHPINSGSLRS